MQLLDFSVHRQSSLVSSQSSNRTFYMRVEHFDIAHIAYEQQSHGAASAARLQGSLRLPAAGSGERRLPEV